MLLVFYLLLLVNAHVRVDLTAHPHSNEKLTRRDDVKGELSNRDVAYTAEFKIGSEEDTVRVSASTSLNLIWFPIDDCNSYNYKRDTLSDLVQCDSAGVYLPSQLSSFKNTSDVFQWSYDYYDYGAVGYFGTDKVQYGDFSGDITFGIADRADYIGELGLGFPYNQSVSSDSTLKEPSFLEQLVKKGDIKKDAYSFQLGINNASEGTLLLGAVDHSKYKGKLQKVKMVDLYADGSDSILILLDGYLGDGFSSEMNIPVLVTMDYRSLIFPFGSLDKIYEHLDAVYNQVSYHVVPCSLLNLTELISFYFSGIEIQVPVRDLIVQSPDFGCLISISEFDGPYHLGQDILKSAYVVVDLDNKEVALAQATISSNDDIEDIVSEIPLALAAPLYSYTEVAEKYFYSSYYGAWYNSLYDVPSRSSYSTNTGSRSVDLGSTTYDLLYPDATTWYNYFATYASGYDYSDSSETGAASRRSSSTRSLSASGSTTTALGGLQGSGATTGSGTGSSAASTTNSGGTTGTSSPLGNGSAIKCLPLMVLIFSILMMF
ncbi:CIC11C00000004599 [Sungouiella intermedia]|uniref:CIC11C00000004599 n=1 Tax=Sungouiella intermedia TaxID=45354 RepID=A0A1L0BI75_9ASCO|nr:CIC11C00000004599 [[Candida] intermedia]